MMPHSNAVLLQHPCGANVMLIGTQHVSLSHGSQAGTAVERLQPSRVVLELDEVCLDGTSVDELLCKVFGAPAPAMVAYCGSCLAALQHT